MLRATLASLTDVRDWQAARIENTVRAFPTYLEDHPEGASIQSVPAGLEVLRNALTPFRRVENEGTREVYSRFLEL